MTTPRRTPPSLPPDTMPLCLELTHVESPTLDQYVAASSEYIVQSPGLSEGTKKQVQILLSAALARSLRDSLASRVPEAKPVAGERNVSGGLRVGRLDLTEYHPLDGLRLAVEIKPVHLAVGRAFWNRFGDVRAAAVNMHLKFPFAVVGGLLTVPTWEWSKGTKKSTAPLLNRGVERLVRAGSRRTESDASHLMEAVGLIAFDPDSGTVSMDLPHVGSALRWEEFVESLAVAYQARFL